MKKGKKATERGTQQRDMFEQVWNTREHRCVVTGKYILDPKARCFAHILPKGMYPMYRHDPRNILLVYSEKEHKQLDSIVNGNKHIFLKLLSDGFSQKIIENTFEQLKRERLGIG